MGEVNLARGTWTFDESSRLGTPGGFGEVFLGTGSDGKSVAIKRLHARTAHLSHREMKITDYLAGHNHPHIIPILDTGFDVDSGHNFIVMAHADRSLQDLINHSSPISEPDALEILDAIAAGLEEIGELVHRDLKPGNVLLHNGVWKLADLGLARFVEAATSAHTMNECLSPQYAAPEQWKIERASKATDIYALGCIIYALITGFPPFKGPTKADLRQQHESESPPPLLASDRLKMIALQCLTKKPEMRATIGNVRSQIQRARQAAGSAGGPSSLLARAAAKIAEASAREEAMESAASMVEKNRSELAKEAVNAYYPVLKDLFESIKGDAPNAVISAARSSSDEMKVVLGTAELVGELCFPFIDESRSKMMFDKYGWDIVAGGKIEVSMYTDRRINLKCRRSANLWFGKLTEEDGYRWWEVSYMGHPLINRAINVYAPFGVDTLGTLSNYQLATNPVIVDYDGVEEFHKRWTELFTLAVMNQLQSPTYLPIGSIERRFTR